MKSKTIIMNQTLISYETFDRVQERLAGVGRLSKRKNLHEDFPLRGFVECADCGTPLTSCWSKGRNDVHPYYLCHKRGCESYGKSIRRDMIEGEFEELLHAVRPSPSLFQIAKGMFRDLWDHRLKQGQTQTKHLKAELAKLDAQVGQFLDRVVEANVPSVIAAYEDRIRKIEEQKLLLQERLANTASPASTFDDALRTALDFVSNPWNLWKSHRLEDRRTVLKLTFSERLQYKRKEGFRTANLSLPFNIMTSFLGGKSEMARPTGFEPVAPRLGIWCSILLSYGRTRGSISRRSGP